MNKSAIAIIIILLVALAGVWSLGKKSLVTEAPPEVKWSIAGSGDYQDKVKVASPVPGAVISSPFEIVGEARGMWFFEGSFPVVLVDWDGKIIGNGIAQAEGEWMTENYVPFKATITFTTPEYGDRGAIILQKDNPSDRRDLDAAIELPIKFK